MPRMSNAPAQRPLDALSATTAATRSAPPDDRNVSTRSRAIGLIALFISTACELSGLFLFAPLLQFTLRSLGFDSAEIGWFSATQWLGMALAAPFSVGWVRWLGAKPALVASSFLPWIAILLISLSIARGHHPLLWAGLYLVAGAAATLRWIVAEATVATLAPAAWRGRLVGLYATLVGATFVIGPTLLAAIGMEGEAAARARWVALGLLGAGVVLTLFVPVMAPAQEDDRAVAQVGAVSAWSGLLGAFRSSPGVAVAGGIGGFFEAGLSSLLPLYGLAQGLSPTQSTLLVSASGLGSALMMLPAGLAADRWPVRRVWLFCARINLLGCLLLPALVMWPQLQLASWGVVFVWGGAGGALYTLAMVHIGHRLQGDALVRTTSVLVLSYTLGSMCAPALGGMALQWAHPYGLPLLLTGVALLGFRGLARP